MTTKIRVRRSSGSFEVRNYDWSQLSEMTRGVSFEEKNNFFNFEEIEIKNDTVFAKAGDMIKYMDGE